jgi:hypothetical protein
MCGLTAADSCSRTAVGVRTEGLGMGGEQVAGRRRAMLLLLGQFAVGWPGQVTATECR